MSTKRRSINPVMAMYSQDSLVSGNPKVGLFGS